MVQAIVIAATLLLIWRQVTLMRLANMLGVLQHLDDLWNSAAMVRHRVEFCKDPYATDIKRRQADDPIMLFFEDIGMQVNRGILDKKLVWEKYSVRVEYYWPMARQRIEEERASMKDNTIYEEFEYLYDTMSKISRARRAIPERTREQIAAYAKLESSQLPHSA
jgi:hypothetical protein